MFKKHHSFICIFLLLSGCGSSDIPPLNPARVYVAPAGEDPRCGEYDSAGLCSYYSISMCELFAHSEKYHNKKITLGGYVRFTQEGNAIYATKEHYVNRLVKDAVWIDVNGLDLGDNQDFRAGYAYIRGKYDRFDSGHFRIFSGSLKQIDFFEPIGKE